MADKFGLRMARATKKDFDAVWALKDIIESLTEYQRLPPPDEDTEGEEIPWDDVPQKLGELVSEWWEEHSPSWFRVVFGGQTMIDNACDPNLDYLDFKPEIKAAMEGISDVSK